MKKSTMWLRFDIMDFVISRLYVEYFESLRHKIHIVSFKASITLLSSMKNEDVNKFAKQYLRPLKPFKIDASNIAVVCKLLLHLYLHELFAKCFVQKFQTINS